MQILKGSLRRSCLSFWVSINASTRARMLRAGAGYTKEVEVEKTSLGGAAGGGNGGASSDMDDEVAMDKAA